MLVFSNCMNLRDVSFCLCCNCMSTISVPTNDGVYYYECVIFSVTLDFSIRFIPY